MTRRTSRSPFDLIDSSEILLKTDQLMYLGMGIKVLLLR